MLGTFLIRDAVTFEGTRLDIADLILLGLITGTWRQFERAVVRGLALERTGGGVFTPEELNASGTEFRRGRNLLSATEFEAWLAERELTVTELAEVLGRGLRRERAPDGTAAGGDDAGYGTNGHAEVEVDAGTVAGVLRAEALCSGVLMTLTRAGIARLAAAHRQGALGAQTAVDERVQATVTDALGRHAAGLSALGPEELTRRLARLWAYEDALAAVRLQVAEPDALRRRLADHRLDWLRLEGCRLRFADEDAAWEARMLIKDDGLDAEEVGLIADTPAIPDSLYLDQLPEPAAGILAATAPGEVAAPWLQDELWNVLIVSAKTTPSEADPVLRERATDELLAEVLRRHAAGRARLVDAL